MEKIEKKVVDLQEHKDTKEQAEVITCVETKSGMFIGILFESNDGYFLESAVKLFILPSQNGISMLALKYGTLEDFGEDYVLGSLSVDSPFYTKYKEEMTGFDLTSKMVP